MKEGSGLPVYAGVSIGPVVVYRRNTQRQAPPAGTPQEEKEKFTKAHEQAKAQLNALYEKASAELGEEHAAIVEVQMLMLEDLDFLEGVDQAIEDGASALDATINTGELLAEMMAALDDEYMKARAADVRDAATRVADILWGNAGFTLPDGSFILVAEDLAPSETLSLPRDRILAFVTRGGSSSSHTAILARQLNIPSLVQANIDLEEAAAYQTLAVDGAAGKWYGDPNVETLVALRDKQKQLQEARSALEFYRGKPSVTKSGKKMLLCANIGSPADAEAAMAADAEGIGLMRSEFLYLGRETMPSEEELFEAYRQVAVTMQGKPVVIRTLDIGADKQVDYMDLDKEENPALGLRGLRLCLDREEVFRTQLRAIFRASAFGNLNMMFPMVASVWELKEAKTLCNRIRQELLEQGFSVGQVPIGVMIETPAAAIEAAALAEEADFFSVGTNDLTQYTLAVDRQNAKLGRFYDPYHPAIMQLLSYVAKCANEAGIWAGICGELGADPKLTETFLDMGYHELSMAAGRVLELRKLICESEV